MCFNNVKFCLDFVKAVNMSGKLKSSKRQQAELHFDFPVESLGEYTYCFKLKFIFFRLLLLHFGLILWLALYHLGGVFVVDPIHYWVLQYCIPLLEMSLIKLTVAMHNKCSYGQLLRVLLSSTLLGLCMCVGYHVPSFSDSAVQYKRCWQSYSPGVILNMKNSQLTSRRL